MFNNDFYPTPNHLLEKMLEGVDFKKVHTVLEPSAGKGDILDFLKSKINKIPYYYTIEIDCIEKDERLQQILKGNNYRLIYNDFLSFHTMKQYDLIIMNPPFSNGDKHLLKAIELQEEYGGSIICLLNAETLRNTYSNSRKALMQKLLEYQSNIEYIQDGFVDAERKTNVEVALIKIHIPEKKNISSLIMDDLKKAKKEIELEEYENTSVITNDFIKEIVHQFNLEAEAGIRLIKEYHAMKPYILSNFSKDGENVFPILELKVGREDVSINSYLRELRMKYWKALFTNKKFVGNLTNNLQSEYYNKIRTFEDYDFNTFNIYQLKIDMNKNIIKGIEETIINLFDELGHKYSYYSGGKNIHYFNGWKTNKSYVVNKKVIIPLMGYNPYWENRYEPNTYKVINKLRDIEKSFNYLDNGLTTNVNMEEVLNTAKMTGQTKNIQLKYFTVTFFKKGTCHITFTNLDILKKFNIYGSQKKGWLPPVYGKKDFKDMTKEEQEVIKNFEGEESYKETLENKEYYNLNINTLLLETEKVS